MIAKLADHAVVRAGGVFKYVRMANDEVRFVEVAPWVADHKHMVDEDERPKSAGSCHVQHGTVRLVFCGSMTLRLPSLPDDEEHLQRVLFS